MPKLICFLKDHPLVGMFSSVSAVLQAFIETATPILQFIGLFIGIIIGLLTVIAKLRELRKKDI